MSQGTLIGLPGGASGTGKYVRDRPLGMARHPIQSNPIRITHAMTHAYPSTTAPWIGQKMDFKGVFRAFEGVQGQRDLVTASWTPTPSFTNRFKTYGLDFGACYSVGTLGEDSMPISQHVWKVNAAKCFGVVCSEAMPLLFPKPVTRRGGDNLDLVI